MLIFILCVLFVVEAFSEIFFFCYFSAIAFIALFIGNIVYKKSYRKKITPTMNFIISSCLITNRWSNMDEPEIGGMELSIRNRFRMRKALRGPWHIKNKKQFNETIKWLQEEGHTAECMKEVQQFATNPESVSNPEAVSIVAEQYKDCGIIAWDMCRLCNVATWGSVAGYISYEEAIKISVEAGKRMQKYFNSWNSMIENYFTGFLYWSGDPKELEDRRRFFNYQLRKEKTYYRVDFNTNLDEKDVIKQRWNLFL